MQFDLMQSLMGSNPKISFKFFTAKRVESRQTETEETRLLNGAWVDPCVIDTATFGIFDMVAAILSLYILYIYIYIYIMCVCIKYTNIYIYIYIYVYIYIPGEGPPER